MSFQVNEYDQQVNKPKSMSDLMGRFEIGREETKHQYEFQEICEDLQKDFGKQVWVIAHKPFCTNYKLKEAGRIARQRGITKIGYLIGVMKKL